jgi:hypothetical protein
MSHLDTPTLLKISGALTLACPYLAAALTQAHFPRYVNEALTLLVCAIAGTVSFLLAGGTISSVHDASTLMAVIAGVMAGAKLYYAKLGVKCPLIDAIEYATGGKYGGLPAPAATQPSSTPPSPSEVKP